jgi:hypothetical protein
MTSFTSLSRYVVGLCVTAALFAGCTSGAPPSAVNPSTLNLSGVSTHLNRPLSKSETYVAVRGYTVHRDVGKSWISPDAKRAPRLLLASDAGTDDVDIFSLPDFVSKGQVTGFSEPQGMCNDRSGDVWVANTGTEQLILLSRAGKVVKTLDDPTGYPVGCAVDPINGNLAVSNIFNFSGAGEIEVYEGAAGTPTPETVEGFYYYYFLGYDPGGDLFLDGRSSSGDDTLGEIPNGDTSGYPISVTGGTMFFPGFVQWYTPGDYLAVGDQLCNDTESACIYWVSISGSTGKIIGSTTLLNYEGGQICDLVQGVLNPPREMNVIGGDYEYCGNAQSTEDRWPYPAGGKPIDWATGTLDEPVGGAVSAK